MCNPRLIDSPVSNDSRSLSTNISVVSFARSFVEGASSMLVAATSVSGKAIIHVAGIALRFDKLSNVNGYDMLTCQRHVSIDLSSIAKR